MSDTNKLFSAEEKLEAVRNEIFYFMTRYPGENETRSYKLLGKIKEDITEHLQQHKHSSDDILGGTPESITAHERRVRHIIKSAKTSDNKEDL